MKALFALLLCYLAIIYLPILQPCYAQDLNGDGKPDLIFSNNYDGSTHNLNSPLYYNDGSGAFPTKTELATSGAISSDVADIDGDGNLDIAFANYYNGSYNINSYLYWGDGNNSYSTKTNFATSGAYDVNVTDINQDGRPDLIYSNYYNGSTRNINSYVYWNNGNRSFSKQEISTVGALDSTTADLNKDGYTDIIFSNHYNDSTGNINSYIYWGDASYSYTNKTELATHWAYDSEVADLNGDGYDDIIFANYYDGTTRNTSSYIYWGAANNPYTTKTELATVGALDAEVADLNKDGYLDIVFANHYNDSTGNVNSYVYWGDANNTYSSRTDLATHWARDSEIGDLNDDGYLDIVFANEYDGSSYITDSYIYWGDANNPFSTRTGIQTSRALDVTIVGNQVAIPEPASFIFLLCGFAFLVLKRRKSA